MIYIATPYSHPDEEVRISRYYAALDVTARIMAAGYTAYSPIVHNHHIALQYALPPTFEFWRKLDEAILDRCDEMWVILMDGWQSSKGVLSELQYCTEKRKLVRHFMFQHNFMEGL